MNIFGEKSEKKIYPQCPCCKGDNSIVLAASDKDIWKEYVCGDCRRVFVIRDKKIKVMGWA